MADDSKTKHSGEQWSPPYISNPPAFRGTPEEDEPPRRWKLLHTVAMATAVVAIAAGAVAIPALLNSSSGQVTIVAAPPAESAEPMDAGPVTSALPAATAAPPSRAAPAATHTASPAARSRSPQPKRTTTEPAGDPTTTAPRYVASPGELATARAQLTRAAQRYKYMQVNGGISNADLLIAAYDVSAADQHLADLMAGRPYAVHRELEIEEATAYLAKADERYRRALADPVASRADREEAEADALVWRKRLAEAQRS